MRVSCVLSLLLALAVFASAATAKPSLKACLKTAPDYEIGACQKAFNDAPKNVNVALALAHALQRAQDYARAVAVLETARKYHPGNRKLASRLAIAHSNLDEQEWLKAQKRKPGKKADTGNTVNLHITAVHCNSLKGEKALNACDRLLQRKPGDAATHAARADALLSLGRTEEAAAAYRRALLLKPDDGATAAKLAAISKPAQKPAPAVAPASETALGKQLAILEKLRRDKLISAEEFQTRRRSLMDQAFGTVKTAKAVRGMGEQTAASKPALPKIDFGNYHALVIGNNKYRHLTPLKSARKDAEAVAALLRSSFGFKVTLLRDATRAEILSQINRLRAELTDKDNLLIYYAGHGTLDRQTDTGFWLPVDADAESDVNWIANATLSRHLRAMLAQHILVVADSCFSGTLFRDAKAGQKVPQARNIWLQRMAEKRSRTAITSGGVEPVVDAGKGGHSVFANAFLNALRDSTGVIEDQALFRLISRPVALDAEQTPQISDIRQAGHEGGAFLFVRRK